MNKIATPTFKKGQQPAPAKATANTFTGSRPSGSPPNTGGGGKK
jgi:hypothetical protein